MTFGSIMTTLGLIAIGVLLFELIILFHEGGHFVAAKLSKVKVNEFSLGMGPKLFSFTKGETTYSLRALPIGGFCAMEGEDAESENPCAFNNVKIYKRMIIIIAGAVMNIVLGLILMFVTLLPGDGFTSNKVESFVPNAFTANCGLQEGDEIVSVNGYKINNSLDFSYALAKMKVQTVEGDSLQIYKQDCASELFRFTAEKDTLSTLSKEDLQSFNNDIIASTEKINVAQDKETVKQEMENCILKLNSYFENDAFETPEIEIRDSRLRYRADLVVKRDNKKVNLEDVDFFTYKTSSDADPQLALDFYVVGKDKTFLTLMEETGTQTLSMVRMVGDSLIGLVKGDFGFKEVSGPIGVASATVEVAQQGLEESFGDAVLNIVYVMTIITVNLGIVNMLPFPALDGGRFVFLLIEAIFKKPIPRKAEAFVNGAGLILLLIFIFAVSFKDVWMLFV